ncbi:N-formylglutamate deformylase [Thalassotalea agarivorans]|uniref:N-formylglutamate deformylase n=1 Tax=Thalassotalea agarivorans TaxID=349064 RepID=A0A1I0CRJ7_THASX|nr:N-formylglutamate deformylase [Thalassotalea agarivorans]SET21877.1 N-formylglutamate deformylase [Thalassotalea agarivorans]
MSDSYQLIQGTLPLLISMPHNGEALPQDVSTQMTDTGKQVKDTDWAMDILYDFAQAMGISVLKPRYNRYLIDLNRSPEDENLYPGQDSTELCPTTSFDKAPLYLAGKEPNSTEIKRRIDAYWHPYHQAIIDELARIKAIHGMAFLYDAHSIASQVPRFFEGTLPDFNFGTADGKSCPETLVNRLLDLDFTPYSAVANGRFKGGYITRQYAQPSEHIFTLQLELSQATYMHEELARLSQDKLAQVQPYLKAIIETVLAYSNEYKTQGFA